jgi:hypothetical protein
MAQAQAPAPSRPAPVYDGPPSYDDVPLGDEPFDEIPYDDYGPPPTRAQAPAPPRAVSPPQPQAQPPHMQPSAADTAPGDGSGPLDARSLSEAWKAIMADPTAIPGALRMILRSVVRVVPAENGQARVEMPKASLNIPEVSSATTRRTLEDALGRRLGRKVTVAYAATEGPAMGNPGGGGGGAPARITSESAKRDRLNRMMEGEPVLAAAVQAWDLELVD